MDSGTVGARRRNMLHGRGSERSILTSAAQRLGQVRTESGLGVNAVEAVGEPD